MTELENELLQFFGDAVLGEAWTRLCIPAFEGCHGEPWIFKTPHHPHYQKDRVERMIRVALSTAAAPTYFEALPNNGREDHEISMLSLHLLQNCMVYVNTLMVKQILARPAWKDGLTPRDLHALTPLIWGHVNPYGRFELDMNIRLDLN